MSKNVNVEVSDNPVDYTILGVAAVGVLGFAYVYGVNLYMWNNLLVAINTFLIAILIWLVLTDKNVLVKLINDHQMVVVSAALLLGANAAMDLMKAVSTGASKGGNR